MTFDEQLDRWLAGESVHADNKDCCPDFSCCNPDLLQPLEVRQAFVAASETERTRYLAGFLVAMLKVELPKRRIREKVLVVSDPGQEHGRIGVGKRVHILERHEGSWATSLCGWAGAVAVTTDTVTCAACRRKVSP